MPRVHTIRANKDYPDHGIKKGDTYYAWKFRHGPPMKSLKPPRPSQLTNAKYSSALAACEGAEDDCSAATEPDDIVSALNSAAEEIRSCADEYTESADNIEQTFSSSPTADCCREKAEQLEAWADELESKASELESFDCQPYVDHDVRTQLRADCKRISCGCCAGYEGDEVLGNDRDRCVCANHQDTPNGLPPHTCLLHKHATEESVKEITDFEDLLPGDERIAALEGMKEEASEPLGGCPF